MRALARGCPNLTILSIEGCKDIKNGDVWFLVQACSRLRSLNMSKCVNLSESSMRALSEWAPQLEELSLCGCPGITDGCLAVLSVGCTALQSLNLSYCQGVGQEGVRVLTEHCLRLLNVSRDLNGCFAPMHSPVPIPLTAPSFLRPSVRLRLLPFLCRSAITLSIHRSVETSLPSQLNLSHCNVSRKFLSKLADELPFVKLAESYKGLRELPDAMQRIKDAELRKIHTEAVLKIQSAWRACIAKGGVAELRRLAKRAWVVPKVQALVRGYLCRLRLKREAAAARRLAASITIQRMYRGHRGRMVAASERRMKILRANKNKAATIIERVYRGHCGRKIGRRLRQEREDQELELLRLKMKCIVQCKKIQCWWRGYLGRMVYKRMVERERARRALEALRWRTSITIQRYYRGYLGRKVTAFKREQRAQAEREVRAVRLVQRIYRGHQGKLEANWARNALRFTHEMKAATKIQGAWRSNRGKHIVAVLRSVMKLRSFENNMAKRIQGWFRGIAGRQLFKAYKEWHRQKAQRDKAGLDIERLYRGYRGREEAYVRREIKKIAAITGKCWGRGGKEGGREEEREGERD